jgi:hypothetical protein
MTNRDPYSDRVTNSGPGYTRSGGWNSGSIIGALVVIAIVVAAIAYAMNRNPTNTATGPNTSTSAPSTTGQAAPGGPRAGTAPPSTAH